MDTTAFQVAKGIGDNLSRGYQKYEDQQNEKMDMATMSDILRRAQESGDPNVKQSIMNELLYKIKDPKRAKLAIDTVNKYDDRIADSLKPKAPAGGITGQSTPPEVSQRISQIIKENPNSNSDDLAIKLDESGIPRAYSNSFIENRRRGSEQSSKEKLELHKESKSFDDQLTKRHDSALRKIEAIKKQKKIQPNISNFDRLVSTVFSGSKFEDLFKAQSAQEFDAAVLPLIEGQKENFGVRLSDADLRLVMQKMATSTKNPDANKTILDWQLLESKLDVEKRKVADKIKRANGGFRPLDFDDQIRQSMEEKFGDEIQKTFDKITSLEEDPDLVDKFTEDVRVQVQPGTSLDMVTIDKYLKISNNDPELAKKMALEDGYTY